MVNYSLGLGPEFPTSVLTSGAESCGEDSIASFPGVFLLVEKKKGLGPFFLRAPFGQYGPVAAFELYLYTAVDSRPGPGGIFFLRLPVGQYGPVSQLSCPHLEY